MANSISKVLMRNFKKSDYLHRRGRKVIFQCRYKLVKFWQQNISLVNEEVSQTVQKVYIKGIIELITRKPILLTNLAPIVSYSQLNFVMCGILAMYSVEQFYIQFWNRFPF